MIFSAKDRQLASEAVKKYLPLTMLLFLCAFLGGVLFVNFYYAVAQESLDKLTESFSFLFNFGPVEMGIFIFLNNLVKIFLFMFLGFLLALPTIFFLILNGWVLGYVVALSYGSLGLKGLFFSLFLHGVFEISALLIGASFGIWIGVVFWKEKKMKLFPLSSSVRERFSLMMKVFISVIVPLLFVATVIETVIIFFL